MNDLFERFGLNINAKKTETMILNYIGNDNSYPQSICTLKNIQIKNSRTFVYLGSNIDHNQPGLGISEINNRINSANAAFQQHKHLLRNHHISLHTRIILFNAYVRSRLTYGCQCWATTKEILNKFDSTYRIMLRKIIWGGFERTDRSNDDFSYKISNKKLHQICRTEDISNFIKQQQANYLAHIIRKENNTATKRLTFECNTNTKRGQKRTTLLSNVANHLEIDSEQVCRMSLNRCLHHHYAC